MTTPQERRRARLTGTDPSRRSVGSRPLGKTGKRMTPVVATVVDTTGGWGEPHELHLTTDWGDRIVAATATSADWKPGTRLTVSGVVASYRTVRDIGTVTVLNAPVVTPA